MTEYFTVENEEGDRIDRYLAEEMPERSRSYLQKLIKEQYIKVNNKPVKAWALQWNIGQCFNVSLW